MQPTLVAQPFHHKGWVYEEKVDGYRIVAQKEDGAVTIISRQGKDFTGRFPDLAKALAALPAPPLPVPGRHRDTLDAMAKPGATRESIVIMSAR
jgi:bifunctional non-homologous end joining protein LigD